MFPRSLRAFAAVAVLLGMPYLLIPGALEGATPAQTSSAVVANPSARDAGAAPATSRQLTLITEPQDGIAPVLSAITGARHRVDMVLVRGQRRSGRRRDRRRCPPRGRRPRPAGRRLLRRGLPAEPGRLQLPQGARRTGPLELAPLRAHPPEDADHRRARLHPDLQPDAAVLRVKPRLRRHRHQRRRRCGHRADLRRRLERPTHHRADRRRPRLEPGL